MNLIIDPKLRERLQSIRLHPARMFVCLNCKQVCNRDSLIKDKDKYYCVICNTPVQVCEVKKGGE